MFLGKGALAASLPDCEDSSTACVSGLRLGWRPPASILFTGLTALGRGGKLSSRSAAEPTRKKGHRVGIRGLVLAIVGGAAFSLGCGGGSHGPSAVDPPVGDPPAEAGKTGDESDDFEEVPQPVCIDFYAEGTAPITLRCVVQAPPERLALESIECVPGGGRPGDLNLTIEKVRVDGAEEHADGAGVDFFGVGTGQFFGAGAEVGYQIRLEVDWETGLVLGEGTASTPFFAQVFTINAVGSVVDAVSVDGALTCPAPAADE